VGRSVAAITGATGFLGRHLAPVLDEAGWSVRVLARRDPIHALWRGVEAEVVIGELADQAALARLCDGAQVLVHAAGLIKARTAAGFDAVNVSGAREAATAARAAGVERMVLVSSLAAREPRLSHYAASKRAGEAAAAEVLGERLTIARPPAIYGPGDLETLQLFRAMARTPVFPTFHPEARIAVIHARDAARQIAALAGGMGAGRTATLSDARPAGYTWSEILQAAAAALGVRRRLVRLPDLVFDLAGAIGALRRMAGGAPILTPGKAREFRHLNWGVSEGERCEGLPAPAFEISAGFAETVDWYRRAGWLGA